MRCLQRFGHSPGNVACAFRSAVTLMLEISKRVVIGVLEEGSDGGARLPAAPWDLQMCHLEMLTVSNPVNENMTVGEPRVCVAGKFQQQEQSNMNVEPIVVHVEPNNYPPQAW